MDGKGYMADDNVIKLRNVRHTMKSKLKPFITQKPEYNIIDRIWFTPGGGMELIGAVLIRDVNMKYIVAYIGTGKDEKQIASWGAKLNQKQAETIFGYEMPDYKGY